ncbi:MAG: ROK family protein [Aerococcaceae bacterium]|nr:ROK family protein [Aerococcaceae bacterium]
MLFVIDIGGTSVKYGLWHEAQLVEVDAFSTPGTWEAMCHQLRAVFEPLAQRYSIKGVAISSPGAVNTQTGVIAGISAIDYIHGFNIIEAFEALFHLPVTIENDANCAALAELHYGAAKDVQNAYMIVIGTGIGGSLIVNRQLIKGKHLFGGELGYMLVNDSDTLSEVASTVNAAKAYSQKLALPSAITGKQLFEKADAGDKIAQEAVERLYQQLAKGIYNVCVCFDPDCVLIGGGISTREGFVERLTEYVQRYLNRHEAQDIVPDIRRCQFQSQANMVGAVAHYQATHA